MVRLLPQGLIGLVFLTLAVLSKADKAASPSPAADTELICPTKNEIDCYPRIFQPTKDFQAIREGQDLPPGLHVRMNISDGTKEARLNIPMEGEAGAELEGIPVEQAMVVVDTPADPVEEIPEVQKAMRDQVPQKPPVYETAGKIQIPLPDNNGGDMGAFQRALLAIKEESGEFDIALDDLQDLSHDIYYGVEIAKNGPVLEKLVCLTLGSGNGKFPAKEQKRDQKAAAILASSTQNNPTALKEIADLGRLVMFPNCGADVMEQQKKGQNNFVGILRNRLAKEKEPTALKSKIKAISGLIREPKLRKEFLETKGMDLLLAIWLKEGGEWDTVREKVAQLVMDNFLDEGMGAELGIWPKGKVASKVVCEADESMIGDGCWEHHLEAFTQAQPGAEWVGDFLQSLREQREGGKKDEL